MLMADSKLENRDFQPLLDVRQNHLNLIFGDSASIDTKCLALLGADLAILIFIGQASLGIQNWWLEILLAGSYVVSIMFGILALWPQPYIGASVDLEEHPDYLELDSEDMLLQLISDTELAISRNQQINTRRWRLTLVSFLLTAIGTILLFVIL